VIVYQGQARTMIANEVTLRPATPTTMKATEDALMQLRPEGASDHAAGLRKALQFQPDAIFLVTDADDMPLSDVASLAKLVDERQSLNVVLLGDERAKLNSAFAQLTKSKRGGVYIVRGTTLERAN
jgi:hypothetical protein